MIILSLIKEISDAAMFVDFKSTCNTVYRKTLFSFIRNEEILSRYESVFLEILYDSIYLKTGETENTTSLKVFP